jgi:hypothetical protein
MLINDGTKPPEGPKFISNSPWRRASSLKAVRKWEELLGPTVRPKTNQQPRNTSISVLSRPKKHRCILVQTGPHGVPPSQAVDPTLRLPVLNDCSTAPKDLPSIRAHRLVTWRGAGKERHSAPRLSRLGSVKCMSLGTWGPLWAAQSHCLADCRPPELYCSFVRISMETRSRDEKVFLVSPSGKSHTLFDHLFGDKCGLRQEWRRESTVPCSNLGIWRVSLTPSVHEAAQSSPARPLGCSFSPLLADLSGVESGVICTFRFARRTPCHGTWGGGAKAARD